MEEKLSPVGGVAYFGGGGGEEGVIDNRQWIEAIQKGTSPLVKPEEALVVTKILDNIYKAAKQNKEVKFEDCTDIDLKFMLHDNAKVKC